MVRLWCIKDILGGGVRQCNSLGSFPPSHAGVHTSSLINNLPTIITD